MKAIYILFVLLTPYLVKSQDLIYVPDDALEYYLENDYSYQNLFDNGIDNDNYVLNADVGYQGASITVPVECEDLTGLEQIIIKDLTVSNNFYIEEINLSNYQFIQGTDLSDMYGGGIIGIVNNLSLNKIVFPSTNQFIGRINIEYNYLLNCININSCKLSEIFIIGNNSIVSLDFNDVNFINQNINYSPSVYISEDNLRQINFKLNNLSYVLLENFSVIDNLNPSLECIEFDNVEYFLNIGISDNFLNNNFDIDLECSLISNINSTINKKTIKNRFDLFGRKFTIKNQPFFELYNDGSVEKKVIIE